MQRAIRYGLAMVLLGLAMIATLVSPSGAAELTSGSKDTIFIGKLKVGASLVDAATRQGKRLELARAFQTFDGQLVTALSGTRVFQIVERKRLDELQVERDFAQSGMVDPADPQAAKIGKMAGAKFAFFPEIIGFEDKTETIEYQAIGRSSMNRRLFMAAVVKIVDTTTGKLLPDAPTVRLNRDEVIEMVRNGQATPSDEAVVALSMELARKLSQEVISLLRPAKVLTITGRQIQINRGSEAGFQKDDQVEVYATQQVKDPDSGEVYTNEVPVGTAVIVRLDKKQSFAMIQENFGITAGAVVRIIKSKADSAAAQTSQPQAPMTPGSSDKPLTWK